MMSVKIGTSVSLVIGSFTPVAVCLMPERWGQEGWLGTAVRIGSLTPESPYRHLTASSNTAGAQ